MKIDQNAEFYEAIRNGVCDAMWRMMTNATDMPCSDFYDAIKAAVKESMMLMDIDAPIEAGVEAALMVTKIHPGESSQ